MFVGLFENAFTAALALGEKPKLFLFDQPKIRVHIQKCLYRGKMEMFPVIRKRRVKNSTAKATEAVSVYCKCRMPEMPVKHLITLTHIHIEFFFYKLEVACVCVRESVRA